MTGLWTTGTRPDALNAPFETLNDLNAPFKSSAVVRKHIQPAGGRRTLRAGTPYGGGVMKGPS